jgi:hypothetical protein
MAPVLTAGRGGKSSWKLFAPLAVDTLTLRAVTACKIHSPSRLAPTRNARAGLPSMASKATPSPAASGTPARGAIKPNNWKRLLAAGAAGWTGTGALPSNLASDTLATASVLTKRAAGACVEGTNGKAQNRIKPAANAQTTKALIRELMGAL